MKADLFAQKVNRSHVCFIAYWQGGGVDCSKTTLHPTQ